MEYITRNTGSSRVYVLLHGTGGDESSLVPLLDMVDPGADYVSIRGTVSEYGMNRYFERLAEGVYDLEDLNKRSMELLGFIKDYVKAEEITGKLILLGYSNGANIAIDMLHDDVNFFEEALLLHPMYTESYKSSEMNAEMPVFVTAGENDPIVSREDTDKTLEVLNKMTKDITVFWTPNHGIMGEEVDAIQNWLKERT